MKLQVIYSFVIGSPQQSVTLPFAASLLQDKKSFFEFVTSILEENEKEQLAKISCFIDADLSSYDQSSWFIQQNGKFYDDDIVPLMKEVWDIDCTYEPINK